jgi:hypothetical protein
VLKKSELSPAEVKYGRAVQRDAAVRYQPDVVIVDNGPEVIRSAGADGFSWTIDARAGRDLSLGKIAFITGRCVGRVLAIQKEGDNLRLVLGPVELTDIFKELEVTVNQEIDPAGGLSYEPPQLPGTTLPLSGDDAISSDWASLIEPKSPTSASSQRWNGAYLVPAAYQLPPVFRLKMQAPTPLNNADGIGMEFRSEKYGLRTVVQAQVRLQKPSLEFNLSIHSGSVNGTIILHNAAGLRLAFDSAVDEGGPRNVTWFAPAGSMSFPISGPVPLAFDVRQELYLDAQFAAGASSFNAGGNYDLNADFGLTFQKGKLEAVGPKSITARKDVIDNITGISIAPRRFAFSTCIDRDSRGWRSRLYGRPATRHRDSSGGQARGEYWNHPVPRRTAQHGRQRWCGMDDSPPSHTIRERVSLARPRAADFRSRWNYHRLENSIYSAATSCVRHHWY